MKICIYLSSVASGGVGKHVVELSNYLAEYTEHDVVCIMPQEFSVDLKGVDFIPFNHSDCKMKWLGDRALCRLLKSVQADVVHSHGNASTKCLSRLRRRYKGVTCATVHWDLKKAKHKKSYNNVSGVIGVSERVLSGITNENRVVIYNGIDKPKLKSSVEFDHLVTTKFDRTKPSGISIGRLVRGKGFHVLLEAWKNIDANLFIVGDGPMKAELLDQINRGQLSDRVFLLGEIPNAGDLIRSADLSIMPSFSEVSVM